MKKPKAARESESKLTPFIAPTISAIGGILVALIALVPYYPLGRHEEE